MYLEQIHERLVQTARERVRTGAVSERKLARLCGVSQPHIHNVLKNIRTLSTESADRLLKALDLDVPLLLWRFPPGRESGFRSVPVLRNRIGPGTGFSWEGIDQHLPFRSDLLSGTVDPVAARVAPDLVMPKGLCANDLVLLDRNPVARAAPYSPSLWVVQLEGGLRIRYARSDNGKLYVADDSSIQNDREWKLISTRGKTIVDIIRAKIIWLGRDLGIAA